MVFLSLLLQPAAKGGAEISWSLPHVVVTTNASFSVIVVMTTINNVVISVVL